MIRTKVFILLLLTALAGCSSEYKHKELGKDCPKADEIRSMIKKLRADKSGTVIEGICQDAGLAQQRLAALRFMLTQIKQAQSIELTDLDSFGGNIYRASITLELNGRPRHIFALLVEADNKLRWAGPN